MESSLGRLVCLNCWALVARGSYPIAVRGKAGVELRGGKGLEMRFRGMWVFGGGLFGE